MNLARNAYLGLALCVGLLVSACVSSPPNSSTTAAIARTVAIGDIHGDFERFAAVLQSTGLVDEKLDWTGGQTTFVQLGDSTDRGADSRKAIDLLRKLSKQALRAGGRVHIVIGNHEVMNVTGDLRYVHPGEYAAFKDQYSERRLAAYYQQTVARLKATTPRGETFSLPKDHREQWNKQFPLGFVAHRDAWSPQGEYGRWTLLNATAVKVADTVFVHGGLSSKYAKLSLRTLNRRVREEIRNPKLWGEGSIIDDPEGPFWYRGWAELPETPENEALLDKVLSKLGAQRMVVGHTPLVNTVLPRFNGKVIVADVGLSDYYGGANAALELVGNRAYALINGQRVPLPTNSADVMDYLDTAAQMVADNRKIREYQQSLRE